jgi:hypothetical protein
MAGATLMASVVCLPLHPTGSTVDVPWKTIRVGQVLKVYDDEDFPSDLLCLYCKLEDNVCFVKTTNLDGGRISAFVCPSTVDRACPMLWGCPAGTWCCGLWSLRVPRHRAHAKKALFLCPCLESCTPPMLRRAGETNLKIALLQ